MDLPWGDEKTVQFITNVGLVTSMGPHGDNVMACEWTHMLSYSPGLIAVCIGPEKATAENIRATKEFGVNLASIQQKVLSSVAGGSAGKEFDKIGAAKKLGFEFYTAKKIGALMIKGAALNAECGVVQEIALGDHVLFVGQVLEASVSGTKPLAYHAGAYWKMAEILPKPTEEERARITKILEQNRRDKAGLKMR